MIFKRFSKKTKEQSLIGITGVVQHISNRTTMPVDFFIYTYFYKIFFYFLSSHIKIHNNKNEVIIYRPFGNHSIKHPCTAKVGCSFGPSVHVHNFVNN